MSRHVLRFGIVSLVNGALLFGMATQSEAGLFPCLWNALFGPCRGGGCGSYYGQGYGAYYPAPVAYPSYAPAGPAWYGPSYGAPACGSCTSGYAPSYYSYAASGYCGGCQSTGCAPCQTQSYSFGGYSPCGVSPCPGGVCGVTIPADNDPRLRERDDYEDFGDAPARPRDRDLDDRDLDEDLDNSRGFGPADPDRDFRDRDNEFMDEGNRDSGGFSSDPGDSEFSTPRTREDDSEVEAGGFRRRSDPADAGASDPGDAGTSDPSDAGTPNFDTESPDDGGRFNFDNEDDNGEVEMFKFPDRTDADKVDVDRTTEPTGARAPTGDTPQESGSESEAEDKTDESPNGEEARRRRSYRRVTVPSLRLDYQITSSTSVQRTRLARPDQSLTRRMLSRRSRGRRPVQWISAPQYGTAIR